MPEYGLSAEALGRLLNEAKAEEREACARLCESLFRNTDEQDRIIKTIADLIRKRKP